MRVRERGVGMARPGSPAAPTGVLRPCSSPGPCSLHCGEHTSCPLDLVGLPGDSLVNVLRRVQGILRVWEGFLGEVGFTVEHGGRDEKGEERPCGGGDDPVSRGREGHGFFRESEEEK